MANLCYNYPNRINNGRGSAEDTAAPSSHRRKVYFRMASSDHTTFDSATEEWRDIPGYEARYQVSNLGRVRSFVPMGGPKLGGRPLKTEAHLLSLIPHKNGYLQVALQRARRGRLLLVHVLVMSAFVSERPLGFVVNHKNGIKTDNRLANLEWVTVAENARHYRDVLGRHGQQRGTQFKSAKLDDDKVREVRRLRSAGVSRRLIAEQFGVGETTIRMVDEGKTWTHVKDVGNE
jgi:HNH endonuclease/NUMOD4 motif-containing protein